MNHLLVEFPQKAGEEKDIEVRFLEPPEGMGLSIPRRNPSVFPLHLKQAWRDFPGWGKWGIAVVLGVHATLGLLSALWPL